MDSKRCVMEHVVVIAAMGALFACSSETIDQKNDEGLGGAARVTGASQGGTLASGGSGVGGSDETTQRQAQAQRYDAERNCFWDWETIEGLFCEEQYPGGESAAIYTVCVISPAGDACFTYMGGSVAFVQTATAAGWKVPEWALGAPFDYSSFSPEEQELCYTAMYEHEAYVPDPPNACTDEDEAAGGAGSGGNAGGTGFMSSGGESSRGGSAGSVSAGAGGVLVEGDAGVEQGGTGNGGRGGSGGAWSCINPACEGLAEDACVDAGCSPYYGEPWMEPGVTRYAGCITPFEQRGDDCESPVMAEICGGPAIGTQDCWMFASGTVPDGWVILEEAAGCESIPECGDRPPVP